AHGAGHVQDRDALGDGDDHADAGVGGLHDGVGGGRRRHENHGGVGPGLAHGLRNGVEEREALLDAAALSGDDSADYLGPVIAALGGVERAGLAEALAEDAGVLVNEDAHASQPLRFCWLMRHSLPGSANSSAT